MVVCRLLFIGRTLVPEPADVAPAIRARHCRVAAPQSPQNRRRAMSKTVARRARPVQQLTKPPLVWRDVVDRAPCLCGQHLRNTKKVQLFTTRNEFRER